MSLADALSYADLGWSTIPVGLDKRPLLPWKEFQYRRPDTREIEFWYGRWANAGVAVVAGAISGLAILDCDGAEGVDEVRERRMPHTPSVATPRGRHYYLRLPREVRLRSRAKLGRSRALDVRAEGGYALAPKSANMTGKRYTWIVPPETPLAELPDWMAELAEPEPAEPSSPGRSPKSARVDFPVVPLSSLIARLPERLYRMVHEGHDLGFYPSRSEADQAVICALVRAGATDVQVRAVFARHPIGEKAREIGRIYLDLSIENARRCVAERGGTVAYIVHVDLNDPVPGTACPRIHLLLRLEDGRRVRVGVTVRDDGRYRALFAATGVVPPKCLDVEAARGMLVGKSLRVQMGGRASPVAAFLPLEKRT